jgi:hypothetical protein
MLSRCIAALVVAFALAVPASALAQSAGDEQYQDPFGGEDQSQSQGGSGGGGSAQPAPAPAATPAPATPAAGTTEAAPAAAGAHAAGRQLPYTGAPTGVVLIAGTILLGGGIALRVRLRDRPDR